MDLYWNYSGFIGMYNCYGDLLDLLGFIGD